MTGGCVSLADAGIHVAQYGFGTQAACVDSRLRPRRVGVNQGMTGRHL